LTFFSGPDASVEKFVKAFYLPMFINKFFTPTEMNSEQFFERWKKLSQPSQEAQKIFPAQFDIDVGQIRTKVILIAFDPQTDV
jgi:AP-2 complex subunit alpha